MSILRLSIKYFILTTLCSVQPPVLDYGALDPAKSAYRINDTHRLFGSMFWFRAQQPCISASGLLVRLPRGWLIDVGGTAMWRRDACLSLNAKLFRSTPSGISVSGHAADSSSTRCRRFAGDRNTEREREKTTKSNYFGYRCQAWNCCSAHGVTKLFNRSTVNKFSLAIKKYEQFKVTYREILRSLWLK